MHVASTRSRLLVGGQIAGTLGGFCLLALWPAPTGKMLAVPLSTTAATNLMPLVSRGDIRIIASGPLDGSYIIEGERAEIRAALGDLPVLLTAAPQSGCASFEMAL